MTKAHTKAASIKAIAAAVANSETIIAAPAANSETIVAVAAKEPAAEVIAVAVLAATKADKARAIFGQCYAMDTVPARKDIIARAVSEAGLTKAGAATYLQNYKGKNGLVTKKGTTPSA